MIHHTDGPWEIEEQGDDRYVIGSDGETIALMCLDVMCEEQRAADARLCAAAPDLLAALERLWAWQATVQELPPDDVSDAVRAALAKATGGTP